MLQTVYDNRSTVRPSVPGEIRHEARRDPDPYVRVERCSNNSEGPATNPSALVAESSPFHVTACMSDFEGQIPQYRGMCSLSISTAGYVKRSSAGNSERLQWDLYNTVLSTQCTRRRSGGVHRFRRRNALAAPTEYGAVRLESTHRTHKQRLFLDQNFNM